MTQESDVISKLVPLEPLNLAKCFTVNDIVTGMSKCSFGARMLGDGTNTIEEMVREGQKSSSKRPVIISDIPRASPVRELLKVLHHDHDWFDGPFTSERILETHGAIENAIVVGQYNRYDERELYSRCGRMVFINGIYQCKPGLVRDGYFPDVIFANEEFILPVVIAALKERLAGKRTNIFDLMRELQGYGGLANSVVHSAHTLRKMLVDEDSTNMFTVSGAMTVGKMQLLIADLIDTGRIKYIAATGALMAHGLIEGSGCKHYKYDPSVPDEVLAEMGLNRVTDSLEPETNFDHIEEIVNAVLDRYDGSRTRGSNEFYRDIGQYIVDHYPGVKSILASVFHEDVPIVTPAFIDSELGNDVYTANALRLRESKLKMVFDSERDTDVLFNLATNAKRLGIFSIGGGVPRNNTQNVAPLHEIYLRRLGLEGKACCFHYGVRIDPAQMFLGHLSGCTYSEGGSWRKFDFDGPRAEVQADATIVWPFAQRFALEQTGYYKMAA